MTTAIAAGASAATAGSGTKAIRRARPWNCRTWRVPLQVLAREVESTQKNGFVERLLGTVRNRKIRAMLDGALELGYRVAEKGRDPRSQSQRESG